MWSPRRAIPWLGSCWHIYPWMHTQLGKTGCALALRLERLWTHSSGSGLGTDSFPVLLEQTPPWTVWSTAKLWFFTQYQGKGSGLFLEAEPEENPPGEGFSSPEPRISADLKQLHSSERLEFTLKWGLKQGKPRCLISLNSHQGFTQQHE